MEQDKIFKQTEGDNWFKRNRKKLNRKRLNEDVVLKVIKLFSLQPKRILELGCANGYRLDFLRDKYGCKCTGIDCSKMAVEYGQRKYRGIRLICGGIDRINFKSAYFDLIVVNFVFHWVDRDILASAISETDRVLKNKGFLIIGDFYPLYPMRKRYHHLKEAKVYTYKDDYSRMFERIGYYQNVGRIVGEHSSKRICADVKYDDRFKVDLLKKDLSMRYGKKW